MKAILMALALVASLTQVAHAQTRLSATERNLVNRAIQNELRDPQSAIITIKEVIRDPNGITKVCGFVNARNGFGGYAGPTDFWVFLRNGAVVSRLIMPHLAQSC